MADHNSCFHDGLGFDGLVHATAALAAHATLPVRVGLYLLALRHPVGVARQLADISRLFPGRLGLGVGVGGEDRREFQVNGIDPRTRGRRTDESLIVLRQLLTGRPVNHHGEFFDLDDALIRPAPAPPVLLLIGGRSEAALRRKGRLGDGWLALWVSAKRFAEATVEVAELAAEQDRTVSAWQHGLVLWCALPGADGRGRDRFADTMQERYKMPFERFEKRCPVAPADELADYIAAYVAAGCTDITVTLPAGSPAENIDGAATIRQAVLARAGAA